MYVLMNIKYYLKDKGNIPILCREGKHLFVDIIELHKAGPFQRLGLKKRKPFVRFASLYVSTIKEELGVNEQVESTEKGSI